MVASTAGFTFTMSRMAVVCPTMYSYDASCGPCITPNMNPLSWLGMKPVGMVLNRYTVPASIASASRNVIGWKRKARRSVISYQWVSRLKPPSRAR